MMCYHFTGRFRIILRFSCQGFVNIHPHWFKTQKRFPCSSTVWDTNAEFMFFSGLT